MSKKIALLLGVLGTLFAANSAKCNWIGQTILDTQKANNGALVFKVVFPRDPEREDRAKEIDDYLHESSTESESYSQKIDSKDPGCIQRYNELDGRKQGPRSGDVAECYSVIDGGHSQCLFTSPPDIFQESPELGDVGGVEDGFEEGSEALFEPRS